MSMKVKGTCCFPWVLPQENKAFSDRIVKAGKDH